MMRILVISQAAWNTSNSFGNTVSNWFDGWGDAHFFHFYARQQKPNTDIVEKYYNVSAAEILKKTLKAKQAGKSFDAFEVSGDLPDAESNREQEQIAKLHNTTNEFVYWGMEAIWRSRKWINTSFDRFINEADPDIIFAFAASPYILEPAIKYIKKKKPSVKVILYIADDVLTGFEHDAWYRRGYLKKGTDYCIKAADRLYGASEEMCKKYSRKYGKRVVPLYKGCTFDNSIKKENNKPLRLVYAGNLLYGRNETLKEVIKALRIINIDERRAVLEVYSNTPIIEEEKSLWYDDLNAFYMGIRPYEEIKDILCKADIVLHVESFEAMQKESVKYSFSTKIIDCLQSGSAILGIGPYDIASIEYIRKIDGAFVIDAKQDIEEGIKQVISSNLVEKSTLTRKFAIKNHDIRIVRDRLHGDFLDLLK